MPLIDRDRGAARLHLKFQRRDLPDIDFAIDFILDPPNLPERPLMTAVGFDEGVGIMQERDRYLAQIHQNMNRLSMALADRLADLAGWNGEKRRDDAERATPGYGKERTDDAR